ncbi:protein translocase subunit SecDF [Mycoplasma miroungirhinis]|uniref:Bifunctional preprotein translocase subunit SecD/SecF n=1 Tax=Mycoplasma miroungirhinis TaxID=754516 RepID=A0A6M4JD00_9MOLU|nr:hypothetical protein [Mycoplasma miroungirhinis]QJR44148.1 hypothetical protein HLA92_01725 [Mycoplasma miroungirhinis]
MKTNNNKKQHNKLRWFATFFSMFSVFILLIIGIFIGLKNPTHYSNHFDKGAKVVLKINNFQKENSDTISNQQVIKKTEDFLTYSRSLHNYDITSTNELISIVDNSIKTDDQKDQLINKLTKKQFITFTDKNGTPLFYKGKFIIPGSNSDVNLEKLLDENSSENFSPSFINNPANWNTGAGSGRISLEFTEQGNKEWKNLLNYYGNRFNIGDKVYIWINLEEFVNIAKTKFNDDWNKAQNNPVNFAYIGNSANNLQNQNNSTSTSSEAVLKLNEINASKYLLTSISPFGLSNQKAGSKQIYLLNNHQAYTDKEISSKINFAYNPFALNLISSNYLEPTVSHYVSGVIFSKGNFVLATVIATTLGLIGIFLLCKYRLLGSIIFVLISLLTFLLISIIFAFSSTITPSIIFAIALSIIISFVLINRTLFKIKREINKGATIVKAAWKGQKNTFLSNLDILAALTILSIFSIYLSVLPVVTIASILFLVIALTTVVTILLGNLFIYLITRIETFDKHKWLISGKSKNTLFTNNSKIDIFKHWKWRIVFFSLVTILLIIVLFVPNANILNNIQLADSISNKTTHIIKNNNNLGFDYKTAVIINEQLQNSNLNIISNVLETSKLNNQFIVSFTSDNNLSEQQIFNNLDSINNFDINSVSISSYQWNPSGFLHSLGWSFIPIVASFVLIAIYLTIRHDFISAFMLFIKEIFMLLFTTLALFSLRIKIDETLIVLYFIVITMTMISHLNASTEINLSTHKDAQLRNYIFSDDEITKIFNKIFRLRINEFYTITLISALVTVPALVLYGDNNLLIPAGFLISIVSLFIMDITFSSLIWKSLIIKKYHNKDKRIKEFYWNDSKIEEQEFLSINDFNK